jgi:hypothetical protein
MSAFSSPDNSAAPKPEPISTPFTALMLISAAANSGIEFGVDRRDAHCAASSSRTRGNATLAKQEANSRIKNLLMHCGGSWAVATICPYVSKSWFHVVKKRCKS